MEYVPIDETNRERVNEFIESQWLTTEMVIRGRVVDMTGTDGIVVWEKGNIVGLLTYLIRDGICEIISLDSRQEGRGIGRNLIEKVKETAEKKNAEGLW
ncbi:GNAT family N-acetyltransferase [Blautia sp. RD014234]|nr:GNAT family N-acetyltransferase [Blautia parvula]